MQKKDFSYLFYLLRRSFSVGGFFTITLVSCFLLLPHTTQAGVIPQPPNNLGLVGYWSFEGTQDASVDDFSGGGNTGTMTNMDTGTDYVTGHKTGSTALDFDGANDYVNIAGLSSSGSYTKTAWVKMTSDLESYPGNVLSSSGGNITIFWVRNGVITAGHAEDLAIVADPAGVLPSGEWFHIAVTYNSTGGVMKLYKDGVEIDSASGASNPTSISGMQMGAYASANYFKGSIDDARVYSRALFASEIATLYSGTQSKFKQSSSKNLVGYWSFEDATGTKATDFSGNGNTGTLTNMDANTDWVSGRVGKALDFDGTDDVVTVENSSTLSFNGATQISMSAWVKTPSPTDGPQIIQKDYSSSGGSWESYSFYLTTSGELQFSVTNGCCSNYIYRKGSLVVPANEWAHVAVVWTYSSGAPSDVKFYMNGVLDPSVSSSNTSGTITQITAGSNGKLFIGDQARDGSGGGARLNGQLDEVRIYNTALTATQIQNLYQNSKKTTLQAPQNDKITDGLVGYWTFNGKDLTTTTATDVSGNGNNGTLTNGPKPAQGKVGQALEFDGVNDYVTMGDAVEASTNTHTISAWIYRTGDTGDHQVILGKNAGVGNTEGYEIFYRSDNDKIHVSFLDTSNNIDYYGTTSIDADRWYHIVAVRSGSSSYLYIDGALEGVGGGTSSSGSLQSDLSNGSPLNIGSVNNGAFQWQGRIDEVRVYNRALSATEVLRLYNLGR